MANGTMLTDPGAGWSSLGTGLAVAGAVSGAIGSFYAVKASQAQAKSQALSLEFEQSMNTLNARAAEREAQGYLESGQQQIGLQTLQAGAQKGSARAAVGARGIQGGVGSARDVIAGLDLAKEVDSYTINTNAVRAANASRTQSVNYQNQGLLAGVSAQNIRRSASSANPYLAAGTSLLGSAAMVSSQWANDRRQRAYYSRSV